VKHTLEQLLGEQHLEQNPAAQSIGVRRRSWSAKSPEGGDSIGTTFSTLPGLGLEVVSLGSSRNPHQPVTLNVGGVRFETMWGVLNRLPYITRLGRLYNGTSTHECLRIADRFDPILNEYLFDRRPRFFPDILGLYQTGKLHMTAEGCMIAFMEELKYWEIEEKMLEECCHQKYLVARENIEDDEEEEELVNEVFSNNWLGKQQRKLWDTFDKPASSNAAKVVGFLSMFAIFISTVILTLDTLPYFQPEGDGMGETYQPFVIIEAVYMGWFTLEFFVRFLSSPSKIEFVRKLMNIVDLLAILPYYISLVFYRWLQSAKSNLPTTTLPPVSVSLGLPMVKPEVGDKGGSSTDEEVKIESESKISKDLK